MPYLDIGGQRLFYLRRGVPGAPAVLLLHGAGGHALLWGAVLPHLYGCEAIALDLPGHGRSEGPAPATIAAHADAVVVAMQVLGLSHLVLAGHSLGGTIALEVALRRPLFLSALVLISTAARLAVEPAALQRMLEDADAARRWIVETGYGPETCTRMKERGLAQLRRVPPEVLRQDLLASSLYDGRPRLGEIGVPTLILCGSKDRLTPLQHVRALADSLPQARLQVVPGASHMLPLEQPQVVGEAIRCFAAERITLHRILRARHRKGDESR